ncbi:DedA family protein [Actinoplanes sp. CA-142083]|uniref:DedA family protein n=1 Tax=Actinoplanes sp. CA-142083 TaxID=3239903 RepID=UPI003D8B4812
MLSYLMPLVSSPWLYVIIFLLVAVDGFVPVAMSEAVLIGLAAFSTTGSPDLAALALAAVAGGMAGDRMSYYVGRKASARIKNGKLAKAKAKAEHALVRQGSAALVIGRFIPYGRTATTLTAGSVSLPLRPFYLASAVSSLLWAAYSIGLGRLGGVTFADSPLLAAAFGIALGFLLAGLHSAAKRLRRLILTRVRPRRPSPPLAADETDADADAEAAPEAVRPDLVEAG